ncbi:MAG: hypothetical protein ACJZ72_03960 [Opitutales bacterium]
MSTFVGFGFGAIQGGLFLPEASSSHFFSRLVVAEIDPKTVEQVRKHKGTYFCNIAESDRVRVIKIEGVEIYNPMVLEDRVKLVRAIAEAQEICTALPSFTLYDAGEDSVAKIICEGLKIKMESHELPSAVIYAAENDSRAASRLRMACQKYLPNLSEEKVVFSETVIAKMCSVVIDPIRIDAEELIPIVEEFPKAFLVEAFNQILIEEKQPHGFIRGLKKFHTKEDLDPFAISKFLGHNAIHALLGYLAKQQGIAYMHEAGKQKDLMEMVRSAFIDEAGAGLCKEFSQVSDPLFSEVGFCDYVDDALIRMVNPFLRDPVDRVTRDPVRKLGWEDRLIGSMKLACRAGVEPKILAKGAALALQCACVENKWGSPKIGLDEIWRDISETEQNDIRGLILGSC